MTTAAQVGTILIDQESPRMAEVLALESDPYLANWSVVEALNGPALDRKIHAVGWNFFFMAAETKVMFLGAIRATKIHDALKRILEKVKLQNFNCLEVTEIAAQSVFGGYPTLPYLHIRGISNRAPNWIASKADGLAGETGSGPEVDRGRTRDQKRMKSNAC